MLKAHIDFESYSEANIWDCGAYVYSQHPSTEILCLAYAIDDGPVIVLTPDDLGEIMPDLLEVLKTGGVFIAHNSFFESCIWNNILVKKYGWPKIPINQFRCTMAKSLARSLPRSLKDVGKALNAPILKSDEGYRTMIKLCKPKSDGTRYESPEDLQKLYDYCAQDVEAERCIDEMIPDLIPAEQTIWYLDQLINGRGLYVDTDAIQKAISISESYAESVKAIVEDVSGGALDGVSRRMAVLEWCRNSGVVITGYTKADVKTTLENPNLPEAVRTVLEAKLQLGKTSVTKYTTMRDSCSQDNRIRDLFIYHGASTGRWAGKLIQIQNLPKGTVKDTDTAIQIMKQSTPAEFEIFYPDVMDALSSCIRGMIIAAPGHQLMVADYAAIEARVVMWLAGEEYGLKQFREFDAGIGEEPYIIMAQNIYQRDDIPKKGLERQLGKTAILGCIAEGSMVYSDKGFIPIETLNQGQRLWDGEQWVNFQAMVPTGKKNVIQIGNLWLTPDHLLLTNQGWQTSAEIVLSEDTTRLNLGSYSVVGQLLVKNIILVQSVVSLSAVNAGLKKIGALTNYGEVLRKLVGDVLKASMVNKEDAPESILILSLIRAYEKNGASAGGILNDDVKTRITQTSRGMVLEAFMYPSKPLEHSWNMLLLLMGGANGILRSIELIMPKGTQKEILESLHRESTIKTKVKECYDIVNCENNRFQCGPFIVHNCGFGMGDTKFLSTCHAWGIPIPADLAKKAVETYRSIYPRVRSSWFAQEAAAIRAVQTTESVDCGRVQWQSSGDALLCRLPSGRSLVYNSPTLEYIKTPWGESKLALHFMGVNGVTKKWEREHTYGGKIVENITQAVARDIMAHAMFRCEKAGYSVAFSVHDEIVAEVKEGFGSISEYERLLCLLPIWADGAPITAKGFITKRYRKD